MTIHWDDLSVGKTYFLPREMKWIILEEKNADGQTVTVQTIRPSHTASWRDISAKELERCEKELSRMEARAEAIARRIIVPGMFIIIFTSKTDDLEIRKIVGFDSFLRLIVQDVEKHLDPIYVSILSRNTWPTGEKFAYKKLTGELYSVRRWDKTGGKRTPVMIQLCIEKYTPLGCPECTNESLDDLFMMDDLPEIPKLFG